MLAMVVGRRLNLQGSRQLGYSRPSAVALRNALRKKKRGKERMKTGMVVVEEEEEHHHHHPVAVCVRWRSFSVAGCRLPPSYREVSLKEGV